MLALSGVLMVTVEGVPVRVEAAGQELRLIADRPVALLRRGGLQALRGLEPLLERLGLTVRLVHRGRVVASGGAGTRGRWRWHMGGGRRL